MAMISNEHCAPLSHARDGALLRAQARSSPAEVAARIEEL
jgi:hypothetical protein